MYICCRFNSYIVEFFTSMDTYLQGFWFIAIPVSLIVVQTVMTFVGANASDGLAADFDGDLSGEDAPFQLFSLRNLVNFLLGFSWTGISFYELIDNKITLIIFAVLVGCLFVYIFFLTVQALMKLAEDNSFKIEETLGKIAQVYIPIPEYLSGRGKVTLSVRGSLRELDAMTEEEKIPSNVTVRIVKVQDQVLFVKREQ